MISFQKESDNGSDSQSDDQPDYEDSEYEERGGLIRLNDTFYVEIIGENLFEFVINEKGWTKTRPMPVQDFEYNFPANINAGFESNNHFFYFIKNDKYCKRKMKAKKGVIFHSII